MRTTRFPVWLTVSRRAGGASARARLVTAFVAGVLAGGVGVLVVDWPHGLLIGWTVAAAVFVVWFWITLWPMGSSATAAHAVREDPGRAAADLLVLMASVASLAAVGVLLLAGFARRHLLQRAAAAALHRFRLSGVHHRHDLPGVGHRSDVEGDSGDGAAARASVVPFWRGHHRDGDQSGRRIGQVTDRYVKISGPRRSAHLSGSFAQ